MVAAVDMTDSFLLLRSLQLPRRLIASPTLHLEALGITCTGGVWSLGLLEAEVAIAKAAAADDVLDLKLHINVSKRIATTTKEKQNEGRNGLNYKSRCLETSLKFYCQNERKVQIPIKLRHAAGRNFYSPERFISNAARGKQAHLHKAISTFSDK